MSLYIYIHAYVQDKQAAVAELSSLKAQVAEAKEKRKKGLSADSLEELTAEQQEQLDVSTSLVLCFIPNCCVVHHCCA